MARLVFLWASVSGALAALEGLAVDAVADMVYSESDRRARVMRCAILGALSLGSKFDIRDFHDAELKNGAMLLDVLERVIDENIAAKKTWPPVGFNTLTQFTSRPEEAVRPRKSRAW